jgi:hypothetical protein
MPGSAVSVAGGLARDTALPSGLGVVAGDAPVLASPAQDILGLPDLAHGQSDGGRGEVGSVDELLDALTTDAEQLADLGGSDEVVHGGKHRYQTTCHLTSAPALRETSHVTIDPLTSDVARMPKAEFRLNGRANDSTHAMLAGNSAFGLFVLCGFASVRTKRPGFVCHSLAARHSRLGA